MLYNIIIGPIEYILQVVFYTFYSITFNNVILSLMGLSLTVSFLTLPLYNRADEYQKLERDKQRAMEAGVKRIKKAFKGDERFWVLSAYYREQDYKSIYVFRSSLSILLQIPFFLAAYHFLSHMTSIPDSLFRTSDQWLTILGYHINVLPIIMTIINLMSGVVYSVGMRWKEKWQIFVLPLVFLVILYNSPAGLVIYWIFNNVFSLVKNLVVRYRKEQQTKEICLILSYMVGLHALWVMVETGCKSSDIIGQKQGGIPVFICVFLVYNLQIYLLWHKAKFHEMPQKPEMKNWTFREMLLKEGVLWIFVGCYIPLSVIAASPLEFLQTSVHEVGELLSCPLQLYGGMFFIWFNIIFLLMPQKYKGMFNRMLSVCISLCIYNFFLWDNKNGILLTNLRYETSIIYGQTKIMLSCVCFPVAIFGLALLLERFRRWERTLMGIVLTGICAVVFFQIYSIKNVMDSGEQRISSAINSNEEEDSKVLYFSQKGQNVLVIMLDRAIGAYVPYIMDEKPELIEAFDGFTYYPNAISMARCTNMGAPELFGGYEYTPEAINARANETLKDKHNEALQVLPVLFDEAGYQVILADLPYANYSWNSDMSIFDKYKRMKAYNLEKNYNAMNNAVLDDFLQQQAFVGYGLFKTSPYFLQYFIYENINQQMSDSFNKAFYASYQMLGNLENMTEIDAGDRGYFIEFNNNLTHEPCELQLPDYTYSLSERVDNSAYYIPTFYIVDGRTMKFKNMEQIMHYHVNMAAFLKLGDWFQFLKDKGVYDNTKIIIAADHGRDLAQFDDMLINEELDTEAFNCLLLYKDFNSHGWHISEDFMTNADVPALVADGVIEDAVNPFTGNPVSAFNVYEKRAMVTLSNNFAQDEGNVFDTSDAPWYRVKGNILRKENWVKVSD